MVGKLIRNSYFSIFECQFYLNYVNMNILCKYEYIMYIYFFFSSSSLDYKMKARHIYTGIFYTLKDRKNDCSFLTKESF